MDTQRILIDTSIAVEGGEAIIAKLEKIAPVFVTDIVLQELDGHKNNANAEVAYQARKLFKRLGKDNGVELHVMPLSNMPLEKGDTLRKMTLGVTPLYVLVRNFYKTKNINDSKIIEVAKDYNMTLVTLDMAQRVRAVSGGVDVATLDAIITPTKEDNKNEGEIMSEIEKLMKKTEVENKNKADFPLGATIGFLLVGALCSLGTNNFWGTFGLISGVILFFAFISSIVKPMSSSQFEQKYGKEVESTFSNNDIYSPLDLDLKNDIVR